MSLISASLGVLFFVVVTRHFWSGLNRERLSLSPDVYRNWLLRGLGVPLVLWGGINAGWTPGLTSFVPAVAQGQPAWVSPWILFMSDSVWLMASYWAAVTFGWMVGLNVGASSDKRETMAMVGATALMVSPLSAIFIYLGTWKAFGWAVMVLLLPGVYFTSAMVSNPPMRPSYSKAVARMKRGNYEEAEWEVIRELEESEGDFEGWMMLAELYARHFRDLAAAEETVVELCAQPDLNVAQRSVALHRLADWHLELEGDPVAARLALEAISSKAPGTHLDLMARQRMDRLPATHEEWIAQQKRAAIAMPSHQDDGDPNSGAMAGDAVDQLTPEEAQTRAEICLAQLHENPNDMGVREELAELWARHLHQSTAAIEQVNLLLGMEDFPEESKPRLLGRLASWLEFNGTDPESLRDCRQRLVREYPRSREAFTAMKKLNLSR